MSTTMPASDEIVGAVDDMLERLLADSDARRSAHALGRFRPLWDRLSEAGLFSLCVPQEYEGFGFHMRTFASVAERLGRHLVPGPIIEQITIVSTLLPVTSSGARVIMDRASEGASVLAFCDQVSVGSHQGERRPRLASGRLSGSVDLVRYADAADYLVVPVETDSEPQVALVSTDAPGLTTSSRATLDPVVTYSRVEFDGVEAFDLIGEGDSSLADRLRDRLRAGFAFELAGLARHLLDASVDYVKERQQFGRPIGSFQAVQHILADLCADQLALEAHCDDVARRGFEGLTDSEALVLKALASRNARTVSEGALQAHGGVGFTEEYELHRWVLHALSLQSHFGDAHELTHVIGARLLDGELQPWR